MLRKRKRNFLETKIITEDEAKFATTMLKKEISGDRRAGGERGSLKERDPGGGGYVPTSFLLTHDKETAATMLKNEISGDRRAGGTRGL